MKELWREPEVIFWVFVFPLLLALGLGIAFRDKPADITPIAVVDNSHAQSVIDLLQRSAAKNAIHADVLDEKTALDRFRLGQYSLVVTFDGSELHYRYDPARPESVLARSQVDDASTIRSRPHQCGEGRGHDRAASLARAISTSSFPACWA